MERFKVVPILLLFFVAIAHAIQIPTQFNASLTFHFYIGDKELPFEGHIYYDIPFNKARIDLFDQSGVNTTTIFRWDLGKLFEIEETIDCDVYPSNQSNSDLFGFLQMASHEGPSTVRGIKCELYAYEIPAVRLATCLTAASIPLELQIVSEEYTAMVYEFFNVQLGPQNPILFNLPNFCPPVTKNRQHFRKKFSLPGSSYKD